MNKAVCAIGAGGLGVVSWLALVCVLGYSIVVVDHFVFNEAIGEWQRRLFPVLPWWVPWFCFIVGLIDQSYRLSKHFYFKCRKFWEKQ